MSKFSKIKFGPGLAVTDEGAGVITVSGSGGGGTGPAGPAGPAGPTGPTGPAGAAGPAGPNVVNDTTASPLVGMLKANGTDVDVAVAGTDYVTVTQLGNKVDRDAVEAATNRLVQVKLAAGDTQPTFKIRGDGIIQWGPGGTGALDTLLYRAGVSQLKTGGRFDVAGDIYAQADGAYVGLGALGPAGQQSIRLGAENLYAAAAGQLKTDAALSTKKLAGRIGADLTVTGNAVTVTNSMHRIATNTGSADVNTINGGADGDILTLTNLTASSFNFGAGGNITGSLPLVVPAGITRMLVYDAAVNKWRPIIG